MGAAFADMAALCAPAMAVEQVAAIANVQSTMARLAIRFNSGGAPKFPPQTEDEAVRIATVRIAAGADLDLGLMGVNGSLLKEVGLTIRGAFDPCLNVKAAVSLLDVYQRASIKSGAKGETAQREALERYFGKGDVELGAMSGFAERVLRESKRLQGQPIKFEIKDWVSALPVREFTGSRGASVAAGVGGDGVEARRREAAAKAIGPPPPWDVFGRARSMPGGIIKTGDGQ